MAFITLEEVKQQSYLNDGTEEDSYLELLISASIARIENYTNRKLYETAEDLPTDGDENALIWNDDLKIGALLMIAYMYENREAATSGEVKAIPFGFEEFVRRYRFIPL